MTKHQILLSVVFVVRNQAFRLESMLHDATNFLSQLVIDYELIIVDNGSDDESVSILKDLTSPNGIPNLQIYALIKEVSGDTASWVGLENSLGDFVAVIDPRVDDIGFLPKMLDIAVSGSDVVFANNRLKHNQSIVYRVAYKLFNQVYKRFNGVNLANEAPSYRVLSKRVINFILQHPQPSLTYRHLPATGGFARSNLQYSFRPKEEFKKNLGDSIDHGMRLLVSTTQGPMRLVTTLSLFGAAANLMYTAYVISVGIFKSNIAPGWISLSLQQSGMFFLISLVLWVLAEYILHMASLTNEGPAYHVGQEFTSTRMTRREKLNIEAVSNEPRAK